MASDCAMAAKARSLFSQHLTAEQYRIMTNYKDVPSIAAYLKNDTRYAQVLDGINESSIHREVLEQKVRIMGQVEFVKLMHYVKVNRVNFFSYYTKRREIEQILFVLHSIESGVDHHVNYYIDDINEMLSFDVHKLAELKSFSALHDFLELTDYRGVLTGLLDENVDIGKCEYELNAYYQDFFKKLIQKEPSNKDIQDAFNLEIELKTIGYVYRLKKYYDTPAEDILAMIHYEPYLIPVARMEKWIRTMNAEEFLDAFHKSPYGKYVEAPEEVNIELHLNNIRKLIAQHYLRFTTNTNLTMLSYMTLLSFEIDNIIDVIEGVRYQMNSEEIMKLLTK